MPNRSDLDNPGEAPGHSGQSVPVPRGHIGSGFGQERRATFLKLAVQVSPNVAFRIT